jgi:ribosomal protein RSM22 (predicted rRNA methylase)
MSSSRAAALASAAMASSRIAQTYPKASPVPTAFLSQSTRHTDRKGKGRAQETVPEEAHEEYEDDGLSSRQRRLSRAARFANTNNSTFTNLPKEWIEMVDEMQKTTHKGQLRIDYAGKQKDQLAGKMRTLKDTRRSVSLHLTTESPFRYAAIASVLRQVRNRLGPDQEGLAEKNNRTWSPTRVVEYSCGAGEGLWAAKDVFGSAGEGSNGIKSYLGIDSNVPTLKSAIDFVKKTMPKSDDSTEEVSSKKEKNVQLNLHGINTSFKPHSNSPDALAGSRYGEDQAPPPDDQGTMVICSYALLHEVADSHRNKLIRTIWKANPTAEVIVFIEEADERGFAALASVREYILGIGAEGFPKETLGFQIRHPDYYDRGLLDEPDLLEASKKVAGEWHVVAPCPHDKPCPLLHDYDFSGPADHPTTRTSSASSPLFHGSTLGMTTCNFTSRLLKPEHTRFAMGQSKPEGSVNYSYLVVRRGPRPSIAAQARLQGGDEDSIISQVEELRRKSQLTKVGDIEEIRAGSKKESMALAEEINEDDFDQTTPGNFDDEQARDELLKMLPQALGREMKQGEETAEMEEAIKLAHDMMKKSAYMAEGAAPDEPANLDGQVDILLTSAFLDQTRQLNTNTEKDVKEALTPEDVEAMNIESYEWPRVIRPAIKKSGHVTFDVCTSHGSIDRFTVSKSSGKQIFQDARKSNYGDLFPHVAFSDEEGVQAAVKSQITRVPSAGTERSGLPATFPKFAEKRPFKLKRLGRMGSAMPSYIAIGADRVSPKRSKVLLNESAKTRRDHTKGDKARRTRDEMDERDERNFRRQRMTPRQQLLELEDEPLREEAYE